MHGAWRVFGVSTHSRPKAAVFLFESISSRLASFNTQPPEGGWVCKPPSFCTPLVSTHSRPKAAGGAPLIKLNVDVFQHTAARRRLASAYAPRVLPNRFNTQPPEGGCCLVQCPIAIKAVSTHSRPKAAVYNENKRKNIWLFQHTAARRRLNLGMTSPILTLKFQHTAARRRLLENKAKTGLSVMFQHTAARRRLPLNNLFRRHTQLFQHTAARRRLKIDPD